MKILLLAILPLACWSCATVKTISPKNNHVQIEHQGKKATAKKYLVYTVGSHTIYVC